jgi:hypothetical protein
VQDDCRRVRSEDGRVPLSPIILIGLLGGVDLLLVRVFRQVRI